MKKQNLSRVFLIFSCFIFCFLFNLPLSEAEEPANDLSPQVFSGERVGTLNGAMEEKGIAPPAPLQTVTMEKDKTSSYDVKVDLSERFKAFLSLGDRGIRDLSGRDISESYSAVIGFRIVLH